jgi:hypothetical protein
MPITAAVPLCGYKNKQNLTALSDFTPIIIRASSWLKE